MNGFYNSVQEWLDAGMPVNSFICGDCMEGMAAMPDKFAGLAIVDPPYGIKRFEKAFGTTRFKIDSRVSKNGIQWDKPPSLAYWKRLFNVSKSRIIWGANNFKLPSSEYFIVWNKMQTVDNFSSAEYAWTDCNIPAKVFNYSIHLHNQTEKIHPTQKPIALYRWLLHNYATPGQLILDTHVGSASSLIACEQMNFPYVGFEIDPDYHAAACKRILQARELLKQKDMFAPEKSNGKSHGEMIELAF